MDHSFTSDNADDLGSGDLEGSPVDSDHIDVMHGYVRPSHSVSQGFVEHPKYDLSQSRSGPSFPSPDRSNDQFDSSISYGPSSNGSVDRFIMQPLAQPRHLLQQPNLNYSYPQTQHQLQSSAYNGVAPQGWPPKIERLQPTWLGNNDRQSGSMGSHRQTPYSPSTPSSAWSNSPSAPTTPSTSHNYFPTLNTPFYPDQASIADYPISSPSNNSHPMSSPSPLYEPVSHTQPNMISKEYAPRVYNSDGTIYSDNSYPTSSSRPLSYPQRNLSRVQTTMGYPNSQPLSSSSSSNHPPGYWSRE
jgi:hypothetical protein